MLTNLLKWMKPRISDRYIVSEIIGPFIGSLFFMGFVFLMFQVLRLADFFIVHAIPLMLLIKMAALLVVSFLPFALPISVLIATLVAFGRLSADSEIVAMKSCGIGIWRLALPAFAFAAVVVLLSIGLNLEWVPMGTRHYKETIIKVSNTKVSSAIREGTFTTGFFDLLIFADKVDKKENVLNRVFIFDEREPSNPLAVVAQQGRVMSIKTESELGSEALLKLTAGNIHTNDIDEKKYSRIDFGEYNLYLAISEGSGGAFIKPRMWTFGELLKRIEESKPKSVDEFIYKTELWRRYTIAFSGLLFVLLGIGYGTIRTRSVRSGAVLVTTIVLVVYWFSLVAAIEMGRNNVLPPWLAMQIPNLIIFAAGLHSFRKAAW